MPKRRRERDRPKAAAEAPYHPNKRVLLSYASDDDGEGEVDEQQPGTGHPLAVEAATVDYQIAVYSDDGNDEEAETPDKFRDAQDSALEERNEPLQAHDGLFKWQAKPLRMPADGALNHVEDDGDSYKNNGSLWSRPNLKNKSTGQWPAIGSLAFQQDEDSGAELEEYDSTEDEAMAYLRSVRSERQSMPTIFRAPSDDEHAELYDSGIGDGRGQVSDGTYIGRPIEENTARPAQNSITPLEAYTTALRARFLAHREHLHSAPHLEAMTSLDKEHPRTFKFGDKKANAEWIRLLRTTAPLPAQVRLLDQNTVRRLLELMQRHHLMRDKDISHTTSTWIWSLLARLDDVGTMNNEQVYDIRELGKQAVLVQLSFHDPVAAAQLEAASKGEGDSDVDAQVQFLLRTDIHATEREAANHRNETDTDPEMPVEVYETPVRENTLATLDMIITIVGDVFGQRDLLDFRQPWTVKDRAMKN